VKNKLVALNLALINLESLCLDRMEMMKEKHELLEFEMDEKETKLKTLLQQFIKLIDYLKTETVNTKKKKTLVERILGRDSRDKDKDKEAYSTSTPPSKTSTVS